MKALVGIIKPVLKVMIYVFAIVGVILSTLYINSVGNIINQSTGRADTEQQDVLKNKQLATTENPVLSPSGRYWLQIVKGYDGEVHFNQFYIIKAGPEGKRTKDITYICEDTFRTRDRTFFLWDKNDRVWVYSGDVGTFFWENTNENKWVRHSAFESGVEEPEELRKFISTK